MGSTSILKREGRCNHCGGTIEAGSEVVWRQVHSVQHDHLGRSHSGRTRWAPTHANPLHCELSRMDGAESIQHALQLKIADTELRLKSMKKALPLELETGDIEGADFTRTMIERLTLEIEALKKERG